MSRAKFSFKDFEPSETLRTTSNQALERILDAAPSDSMAVARLTKRIGGYEALFEVFSHSGQFTARTFEADAESALNFAASQMMSRLEAWKLSRFEGANPDDGFLQAANERA
ncbi:MAG TPA: hypothetical protein VFV50_10170 [Bdellovibrionales bacterium]|nr:hypothetical protein [Bdellovibrionales bacterium]